MTKRRITLADFQVQLSRSLTTTRLRLEHTDLASRLQAESGWSVERVSDMYRLAGGTRWKSSVSESDSSTCARGLLDWLSFQGLRIYSRRALVVAGEGNGSIMTREVLRQLRGDDDVVILDPDQTIGRQLIASELVPMDSWPWDHLPQETHLDALIRVANARDVSAIETLRSWESQWLRF